MDQKLLEALNNLSLALELISESLNSKSEAQSATAKALQGGQFLEEIKNISKGIDSLKKDNQTIIKNQETLLGLAKDKSGKKNDMTESLGKDKEKQKGFKEGLGVILLLAVAVLALGVAFKLIGNVNFGAVVSLSLAILLISIGFSKMFKVLKENKFDAKTDGKNFVLAIVAIATGFTLASWILAFVIPLTFSKLFTIILLGVGFTLIAPAIMKVLKAFSKMSVGQLIKSVLFLPLIMPAIALGLAFASWALQLVKPISFVQALSAIFVAAVFAVVAFGIRKMLKAFDGMNIIELGLASLFLPIILPAIAYGIALSSGILQQVQPFGFSQFVSTIFIAAVFAVISFGIGKIIKGFQGIGPAGLAFAIIGIPILLPLISLAIAKSSEYLAEVKDITFKQFLVSLGISVLFFALSFSIKRLIGEVEKVSMGGILKLPIVFTLVSAAIMASSHILALTKDIEKTKLIKIIGFGIGLSVIMLIMSKAIKPLSRLNPKDLIMGGIAILGISAVVMAASHILALGNYKKYPTLDWALGVSISLGAFGLGMVALGTMITASFGLGAAALAVGAGAVLGVASTIVAASHILAKGNYKKGPTKDWAEGVSLAIGAFSPVYGMLMKNAVLKIFGSGGVGPKDFKNAILIVADGIIAVAEKFQKNTATFKKGYPSKEWSEGVGLALKAFFPIFRALSQDTGWFTSGSEVISNMIYGIKGVSSAIVASSFIFSKGKFDTKIDPNFVKKIRGNILDFAKLTDDLRKYQTGSPIERAFGLDPISNIAKGMVKIASAYDRLAIAMRNFSRSLNSMDGTKLVQFRALTANLAVLSALDSRMFSNMMSVLERRAGVFGQMLYKESRTGTSLTRAASLGGPEVRVGGGKKDDGQPRDARGETQLVKLDKIITILRNQNIQVKSIFDLIQEEAGKPAQNEDMGDKE